MASSIDSLNDVPMRRDWWPVSRLLIVCAVLGAWFRPFPFPVSPGAILEVAGGLFLVSAWAAQLYLGLALLPVLLLVFLNDWTYGLSRWICQRLLRVRTERLLCAGGLFGELATFLGTAELLVRILSQAVVPVSTVCGQG